MTVIYCPPFLGCMKESIGESSNLYSGVHNLDGHFLRIPHWAVLRRRQSGNTLHCSDANYFKIKPLKALIVVPVFMFLFYAFYLRFIHMTSFPYKKIQDNHIWFADIRIEKDNLKILKIVPNLWRFFRNSNIFSRILIFSIWQHFGT